MNEVIPANLPARLHRVSEYIHGNIHRIDSLLSPSAHRQQWWASAIVAVNKLEEDTDQTSVLIALANLCQTGLMLGESLGHAYLSAFKFQRGANAGKRICTLIIGYKGFLELAYRNQFLAGVTTELVLDGEPFEVKGTERGKTINHEIDVLNRQQPTEKNIVGAYCTYTTRGGYHGVTVASTWAVKKLIADQSQRYGSLYKGDTLGPMVQKHPLRMSAKSWRLGSDLANAIRLDEEYERGEPQSYDGQLSESRPAATSKSMLAATLEGKCGCTTDDERSAVCKYVAPLAAPWEELDDAAARQILLNLNEHTTRKDGAVKWSDILPRALAN